MPAERYRLVWQQVQHATPRITLATIDIQPRKLNELAIDSGVQLARAAWIEHPPYYLSFVDSGGTELGGWRSPEGPLFMPPGTYTVFYCQREHVYDAIPLGEIVIPEHGFAKIEVNSGVRFKPQPGAKPPYEAIFVRLDDRKEFVWYGHFSG